VQRELTALLSEYTAPQGENGGLQSASETELQRQHSELQSGHGKLKEEHSKLKEEHNVLQSTHSELQSTHSELQSTHSELQSEQHSAIVQLSEGEDVLRLCETQLSELRGELEDTKEQLVAALEARGEAGVADSDTHVQLCRTEYEVLLEQLGASAACEAALQQQLDDCHGESGGSCSCCEDLESQLDRLRAEDAELLEQALKQEVELETTKRALQAAEDLIDGVLHERAGRVILRPPFEAWRRDAVARPLERQLQAFQLTLEQNTTAKGGLEGKLQLRGAAK